MLRFQEASFVIVFLLSCHHLHSPGSFPNYFFSPPTGRPTDPSTRVSCVLRASTKANPQTTRKTSNEPTPLPPLRSSSNKPFGNVFLFFSLTSVLLSSLFSFETFDQETIPFVTNPSQLFATLSLLPFSACRSPPSFPNNQRPREEKNFIGSVIPRRPQHSLTTSRLASLLCLAGTLFLGAPFISTASSISSSGSIVQIANSSASQTVDSFLSLQGAQK